MNWLIKTGVRTKFAFTRRNGADRCIREALAGYETLAAGLQPGEGSRSVRVPALPGVDEDMREWSIYQMLEHNVIVNGVITKIVPALVKGVAPQGLESMDPKKDVMPAPSAGEEQVAFHRASVEAYLAVVEGLPNLKTQHTRKHPNFGDFDAHQWHCMFGFHLELHLRQARVALKRLRTA